MLYNRDHKALVPALLCSLLFYGSTGISTATEPFKLGVEEKQYLQQSSAYAEYPAFQASTPATHFGSAARVSRPPLQSRIQKVVLPPEFLGVWSVQGQRTKVEAQPQFQTGAENSFALATNNTWTISGNANSGYVMSSNTGIQTSLIVDKVRGSTAFIRYQHPMNNTMAREAIVMSLSSDGLQFTALERVSIIKQGEPPRASVTYQLAGVRQR